VETNLHYNYFRDYDLAAGRYLKSDPIGIWGGLNTYAYANMDPISFVDPRGETPAAAAPVIGTVVGGGTVVVTGGVIVAGGIGYGAGTVFNNGLNRILENYTGTSLGGLIYEMCTVSEEEKRCKAILRGCREGCRQAWEDGELAGVGSDLPGRLRNCVRDCMEEHGCFNY
jgi:hypothetical protein